MNSRTLRHVRLVSAILPVIVLFGIVFFSYVHFYNRPVKDLFHRRIALEKWRRQVLSYVNKYHRIPSSLYESSKEDNYIPYFRVGIYADNTEPDNKELLSDPRIFHDTVEYALYSGQPGWFICELSFGTYYPDILLIDDEGKILSMKRVPGLIEDETGNDDGG